MLTKVTEETSVTQSLQHHSTRSSFQPRRMPADLLLLVLIVSLTIDAQSKEVLDLYEVGTSA